MNIVLAVHHFPPRYSAGAELYTLRLARWLRAHGHAVEVVCIESVDWSGGNALSAARDTYDGLTVWRIDARIALDNWWPRNYDNPLLGEWFASYLRRAQPDIAHFQAGYLIGAAPLAAALDADIPTVLTLHDYWYLCPRTTLQRGDGSLCRAIPADPAGCAWCMRLTNRRYRLLDQASAGLAGAAAVRLGLVREQDIVAERRARLLPLLARPGAVIAPSRFLADRFAPFVPPERLHVSRYGLEPGPFLQQRRPAPDGALRIGFTGQIAPHKGVHLLVEAFRRLRPAAQPAELHLYGGLEANPDYVQRLRQIAADDPRIRFHGRFENSRAGAILAGLGVAVVPSVWYENSPLAIMEAHAAGTPVITAALGGMAELVRDGVDGLHFRAADAADLARQLQRLVDEPGLLPRLRAGVTMPRMIDDEMLQVMQIYRDLLPARRAALQEVL